MFEGIALRGLRGLLIAGCAVLVGGAAVPSAGPIAADLLQNLHWRSIGPFRGGRVLAVAGAPDDRRRFYFGAVNGGVWQTDDAGRTWAPIFDAAPVGSVGAIAVAPSAPATIYVGTGEADMRSDIAQGDGVFRSVDGGRHWAAAGLADSRQIGRILVDPRDANTLLVAALGHPYGPNAMRGVFRSSDGGRNWTRTLFRDADTGAIDLAFKPGQPDVVYAALWQTRRPPWNVYPPSSGPGSGLYKSVDGGRSWVQLVGHGLPGGMGRIGLAVSEARPGRVYALVNAGDAGGLFRSDDEGGSWVRISADKRITERGWYFSGVTADPANADVVYVCDTIVLRSVDGGAHFAALKGDPTGDDFHSLWIDPHDSARRILGVDQGTLVSVNGGQSWSSWYNQPTGQFYHVSTDRRFPYRVYGAQQDSGAAGVDSRSDDVADGISMLQFHESAAGGESDNIAPDPDDPDSVYGGRVDRLDLRSGQMRSVDPTLAFPDAYRGTWTLPLVWGVKEHTLYFANQRVFRTRDGGEHWVPASPDLTRPDAGVPGTLDAPTAADVPNGLPGGGVRRGVVYALAPSPLDARLIWAGTDDGLVWRTADGGAHWVDVTPVGLAAWSKIGVVEASHFDAESAYLAVDRHRLDDPAPYVYRTHDGGRNWTLIVGGLPNDGRPNSVNVVREDAVQRGLLYAGTEAGAFVSFDDGGHWQGLQTGLPPTSVRDMVLHAGPGSDDLVIATHGRGFYILDDMGELRALAGGAATRPLLFPVADAVRLHPPDFTGTPMPKDEPLAANPPDGLVIDYALPVGGARLVEIAISDGGGRVVRRYRSSDPVTTPDAATLPVAPEWVTPDLPPGAGGGAHRFVWDLHYEKPAGLSGGEREATGVWAPPGAYGVSVTVDGVVLRGTGHVLADPRLRLRAGDLQRQFDLAKRIEAARVAVQAAVGDAKKARHGLIDRIAHADAASKAALQSELALVDGLVDPPVGDPRTAGPGPREMSAISDRLDALAQAVDGADADPSGDAVTGFAKASAALGIALARWNAVHVRLDAGR